MPFTFFGQYGIIYLTMEGRSRFGETVSVSKQESREEMRGVGPLTNLFRETKSAWMEQVSKEDTPVPWQEWFAAYARKRVQESLGDGTPELVSGEGFSNFLENAEYTHNADWPEYFGLILLDYMRGRDHEREVSESEDSADLAEVRSRLDDFYLDLARAGEAKADADLVYLANLLKETKKNHLTHQEDPGGAPPWASWYAGYLSEKLPERFKGVRSLTAETIERLLEQAEEMHTAEWPTTYATAIIDELRGTHGLSGEEAEELRALRKRAEEAGRIEKIADGSARRLYLALNLKRVRGVHVVNNN